MSFSLLIGCAAGDEAADAAPTTIDALPDVPRVEVSSEDTTASEVADSTNDSDAADTSVEDIAVDTFKPDTAPPPDTAVVVDVADVMDAPVPWSHTIAIDGANEFYAAQEKFTTTSAGYDAYITWDATYLYFAMNGADVGTTTAATKWVFLYIDTDPGASTGASSSEKYNTQQAKLPTGFGAEYYLRWKTDNSFATLQKWDAVTMTWTTHLTTIDRNRTSNFVEFRLPRATFASTAVGLVSFMINEAAGVESTYAGLYSGNFTDGYAALKPLTKYLHADMLSPTPPNSPTLVKP